MECGAMEPNTTANNAHRHVVRTANKHTGLTMAVSSQQLQGLYHRKRRKHRHLKTPVQEHTAGLGLEEFRARIGTRSSSFRVWALKHSAQGWEPCRERGGMSPT